MLVDISKDLYRKHFPTDPSPYISEAFIALVENKTDNVVRLVKDDDPSIGLVAGVKNGLLSAPFSSPFGGFHYSHEHLFYDFVFDYLSSLKEFVSREGLKEVTITLPLDLYQSNMNAKFVNAFIRQEFVAATPDIVNWIDLKKFNGTWAKSRVTQNCRKAIKHGLSFHVAEDLESKRSAYQIIQRNRTGQDRQIHMSFEDIMAVGAVIPVDFFLIKETGGNGIGAGVFYRGHEKIVQGIFLGDDIEKRFLGIMDFLLMNIYDHYKKMDFDYIDLGTSSLNGEPNVGLIRFKEIHNCASSLRYTFSWAPNGH